MILMLYTAFFCKKNNSEHFWDILKASHFEKSAQLACHEITFS